MYAACSAAQLDKAFLSRAGPSTVSSSCSTATAAARVRSSQPARRASASFLKRPTIELDTASRRWTNSNSIHFRSIAARRSPLAQLPLKPAVPCNARISPAERPYTAVMIVPTGIGASIGGYAGDALPAARALAEVVDCLITHPNVLNGAQLFWPMRNTLYVEGYALDKFAAGEWGLRPVHSNRVGLILDAGIEPELRLRHVQAADACRATLGLQVSEYVVTDEPLGVELSRSASGASWGTLRSPGALLRAAEGLLARGRTDAVAVVARFPDGLGDEEALQAYREGRGVDPLAGAEAVISHLVVSRLRVPCAHAPALAPLAPDPALAPKSAAEEIGHTFLPCVLAGLARAPLIVPSRAASAAGDIWREAVDAVVAPDTACGGPGLLALAAGTRARLVTVRENETAMRAAPDALGIPDAARLRTYLEAVGWVAAHKAGVDPACISPRVEPLPEVPPLPRHDSVAQSNGELTFHSFSATVPGAGPVQGTAPPPASVPPHSPAPERSPAVA
eukprot:tig00021721_g23210.t1